MEWMKNLLIWAWQNRNSGLAWQNARRSIGSFGYTKLLFLLYYRCIKRICWLRIRRFGVRIPMGAPLLVNLLIIYKFTVVYEWILTLENTPDWAHNQLLTWGFFVWKFIVVMNSFSPIEKSVDAVNPPFDFTSMWLESFFGISKKKILIHR